MMAATEETRAAMAKEGHAPSHPVRSTFRDVRPREHLALVSVIDFLPGVAPYESLLTVDLAVRGDQVTMTVTLHRLHDDTTTAMQVGGFTSQLRKLDVRFR